MDRPERWEFATLDYVDFFNHRSLHGQIGNRRWLLQSPDAERARQYWQGALPGAIAMRIR